MTNEVRLAGRVTRLPVERELPSGDKVVAFRLAVPRPAGGRRPGSDWVDCAAWTGRLRRMALRWKVGDEVEISGALRRRVFRAGPGVVPVVEIEVTQARRAVTPAGHA